MGRPVDESPCASPTVALMMCKPMDLSPISDSSFYPARPASAASTSESPCGSLTSNDSMLSSGSDNTLDSRADECEAAAPESPRGILKRGSSRTMRRKSSLTFHPSVLLWNAVQQGQFGELTRLLESVTDSAEHLDVDRANHQGITPLHLCCFAGATECVRLLLARGAFPNSEDKDGWSPVHAAAIGGHFGIMRLLSEAGADLAHQDVYGRRPSEVTDNEVTRAVIRKLVASRESQAKCTAL